MRLDTDEIADAVHGERLGPTVNIDGATIDSRGEVAGRLFVPIVADRDGHDFVDDALARGAAAYLTSRDDTSTRPGVRVEDTLAALIDLGRHARSRLESQGVTRIVGVTGSVGKTSTKDLLTSVLATSYTTCANRASFNNEMGVPLTLLEAPDDTEAVISEMGARGVGHIAMLCEIARPTVGVVTAVAAAHMEMFESLEQIARAKGELVEALPASGTAVLNADFSLVDGLGARTDASVLRYGVDRADVDVHAEAIDPGQDLRPTFTIRTPWGSERIQLAAHGVHQISNALGAAAAGLALEVPFERVVEALGHAELSPMRMDVRRRGDGLIVIDDSYNANPTSTAAALRALATLDARRRFAVLGEMAELGPTAAREHREIEELASALGIAVIAVGTTLYGPHAHAVGGVGEVVILLGGAGLGEGDAVLVKGSRVAGLEALARRLA